MSNQQQLLSNNPQAMESLKSIFDTFDANWRRLKAEDGAAPADKKRLEVTTSEGTIWFPTRWEDVTLDQFIRIQQTDYTASEVVACLTSNSEILARLSPDGVRQIIQALPFLQTPVPMSHPMPTELAINNRIIHLPEDIASLHTFGHVLAWQSAMAGVDNDGLDWIVPTLCTLLEPLAAGRSGYFVAMGLLAENPLTISGAVNKLPYWQAYPLALRYIEIMKGTDQSVPRTAAVIIRHINPQSEKPTLTRRLLGLLKRKPRSQVSEIFVVDSTTKQQI